MHRVDLVVVAAYMLLLLGVGVRFRRGQTTTGSYFVANRAIPGWAAGISLVATIITSVTFIAYPGAAYAGNWNLLVPGIVLLLVLAAIGPFIVPFFRHVVSMSAYEYFGQRFGPGVRMYASFAFAAGHFAKMGFVFYLLALSLAGVAGLSIAPVLIALGAVAVAYTFIGGLRAVIWTDVAQGFLLATGVVITLALLLFSPQVSAAAMLHLIAAQHKASLGSLRFNLAQPTVWTLALYGFFFYLQKYTADQTVVQRYLAARTDREALRGAILGGALCLPVWTAFMLIGSLLWAFYALSGIALPATLTRADQIFPWFIVSEMPAGAGGLILAALCGAAMSMLASDLNCLALVLTEDFYAHFFPRHTDAQRLRFGKAAVVLCGVLAIAVALALTHTHGLALALYYTATAIVAGGLAGLFLLAFLAPRAGSAAAVVGIVANLLFTAYASLTLNGGKLLNLGQFNYPWHEYTIGAIGNLLLLGIGLAAAFLLPARAIPAPAHTFWDWLQRRRSRLPAIHLGETP